MTVRKHTIRVRSPKSPRRPMSLPGVKAPPNFIRQRGVGSGSSPAQRYVPPPRPKRDRDAR